MATDHPDAPLPAPRILSPGHLAVVGAVLLAAALLVLLIVRLGHSNHARDEALAMERHSYEVMLATRSAESSMASAEAALGRYAIGADRAMGATYYNDWVLAGAQIERLATQIGRDPEEVRLVARLQALYATRGRELGLPAQEAAQHRGWAALNAFNAVGHSAHIGEIKRTLEALREHERAKLVARFDRSESVSDDSTKLAGLLSLTGLALVAAAAGLAWAVALSLSRRRQAEADADWLHEAVALRTAELTDANRRLQAEMADRAAAEAQLRQMQKMDAVGRLTGGIAHDFNNMLAVIIGGLDLARRRLRDGSDDAAEHLARAMEGAERAAALTRRLLGFARAEPLRPETVQPTALIAAMSDLIDRALGERVTVETRLTTDCWTVRVDPLQFENAVLNLAVNGRDAMDGAGTIIITAENVRLHAGDTLPAGDYAAIRVCDTGSGMTPEVLERVFEPFFTTKPVGKGTGLGMSQIFGFVRQSGGDVAIDTTPGRGTTVSLYLPRAAAQPAALPARADIVPINTARQPARPILLVEDDARVRAGTASALEELGHPVIACESGAEALALLAQEPVAMVITDVVMPGMTGPELAGAVRARHPAVELLFVTGYSGDEAGDLAGEALLRKPFTIAQLESAVTAAFARANAPHPAPGAAAAA